MGALIRQNSDVAKKLAPEEFDVHNASNSNNNESLLLQASAEQSI